MLLALTWLDHAFIVVYLTAMIALGVFLSRGRRGEDEYFLGGRRMPWFAVGVSIIASLLSSLTYLSEPGEVWKSGITHISGKMLAIPFEMLIVWMFCIPFMMRFRFTSAYEYLEQRFGRGTRLLGVSLFLLMVTLWMGFVVLASAKAMAAVSGMPLFVVIATTGLVATVYTMLGGLRAVIWTDVVQVVLLIGGGLFVIVYVMLATGTWLPDWYATMTGYLERTGQKAIPVFSFDPTVRATVVTVAINMCIWHVCTHTSNQMTVQRYFSTVDVRAARRSFVTGSLFGVGINLMLVVVGLAVMFYYVGQDIAIDRGLSPDKDRDLIFPTFAVTRLPPGVGGGIIAALLAAAMSTIDSGINSTATVLSVELRGHRTDQKAKIGSGNPSPPQNQEHLGLAMVITLLAGLFVTIAAYGLTFLPEKWGIVGAMPRTFNAITAPLGGLFLVGMFLPRVGQSAMIVATFCGLATSIVLGYFEQVGDALRLLGFYQANLPAISFTLIMPAALTVTILTAWLFSLLQPPNQRDLAGLTWYTRENKKSRADQ